MVGASSSWGANKKRNTTIMISVFNFRVPTSGFAIDKLISPQLQSFLRGACLTADGDVSIMTPVLVTSDSVQVGLVAPVPSSGPNVPSPSMQSVWCWPPEKSTQEVTEFLKQASLTGEKLVLILLVPGNTNKRRLTNLIKCLQSQKPRHTFH